MSRPDNGPPTRLLHVDEIVELYETLGGERYDEAVSQADHAAQCAALARRNGENDEFILAALLHDIGHLLHMRDTGTRTAAEFDTRHEVAGADALSQLFGAAVVEPIRHHVMAKRVLLATEPDYARRLSPGSSASAVRQGGPASQQDVEEFLAVTHADAALRLRRLDDAGKVEDLDVDSFATYRPLLVELSC